jgi:broad specificity phosphatase PhoE
VNQDVHLLRHGQTDYTEVDRFCGRHDPPLNVRGVAMAWHMAASHTPAPWGAVYTSPLRRARQTAEVIAALAGLEVDVEPGLRELDFGEWEGQTKREVEHDERYRRWSGDPDQHAPPRGETASDVAGRAVAALERIRAAHDRQAVLLVSHKAVIRILVCHYLDVQLRYFRDRIAAPAGSLTTLRFGDRHPMLVRSGDMSHLPPGWRSIEDGCSGAAGLAVRAGGSSPSTT